MRQKKALDLVGEGLPLTTIAGRLNISVQSVRKHLRKALETESLFPSSLTPERISQLRQIESEKLQLAWKKVAEAFEAADPSNGIVVARLAEASAKLSERQAAMWGLNAPTRIVEESLRLQVTRRDHKVTITYDPSLLAAPTEPVPGLIIGGRTPALVLAEPSVESADKVMIAEEQTNALESPLNALVKEA